ncbi:MAG TPA: PilZ domain-containing protein [Candidatus Methylomirabilis sp.]|nr:PilZ domain-containing protein [Candidatus Methylomirabilis sp.]HSB81481.1 PilZ domain-containing protein [Candidatus Methylomirabilis sp.]HSC71769.1 PilZ domain-containing protein [Candidatus Methylomirabilis sp.]
MEHFGKIACSKLAEVWVSLQEVQGKPHLVLRIYDTPPPGAPSPIPRREAIALPIDQLPILLRVLTHAQEICMSRGLLYAPATTSVVVMQDGVAVSLPLQERTTKARQHTRVPVQVPVECRLVEPDKFWPDKSVSGEIRDLSLGGAQVWLRKRFPRFKEVSVACIIDGKGFQARAQVVSVELESHKDPETGLHRHGLRWVAMEPKAREVLTEVISRRSKGGPP